MVDTDTGEETAAARATGKRPAAVVEEKESTNTDQHNGKNHGNQQKVLKTDNQQGPFHPQTSSFLSRKARKQTPSYKLRSTIQICCKANDLIKALQMYDDAVAQSIHIDASVYYSLLALCDGVQHSILHIGRQQPQQHQATTNEDGSAEPSHNEEDKSNTAISATAANVSTSSPTAMEEVSLEDRKRHAFRIKAAMDDAKIPLNEASYTSFIKLLIKTGDLNMAHTTLLESETVQQCKPKLRLYAALLHAYAEQQGNALEAVQIWYLLSKQNITATEREYLALLRCAVQCQSVVLMETVLTDLAEDVPIPSIDTHSTIIQWFRSKAATTGINSNRNNNDDDDTASTPKQEQELKSLLDKVHAVQHNPSMRVVSPYMGPVVSLTGWEISNHCPIDSSGTLTTGCLVNESLHPIEIAKETWEDMQKASETIGSTGQLPQHQSAYRGGGKGSKRLPVDAEKRKRYWNSLLKYLDNRRKRGQSIDVVIDGANVGYTKQNFAGSTPGLQYDPIDWMIRTLQEEYGKSVLVVMHSRHFIPHKIPPRKKAMVDAWFRQGLIFQTPPGMDDDTFWMHVAFSCPGTLVVTNDEMRDHHFQMLAPRCFLRWKDRHQVKFEFSSKYNTTQQRCDVQLSFPDAYTRRIQRVADGIVVPLPKRGDAPRFLDGVVVADGDTIPDVETYLCIRPKKKELHNDIQ
jgi:hypothetical protein